MEGLWTFVGLFHQFVIYYDVIKHADKYLVKVSIPNRTCGDFITSLEALQMAFLALEMYCRVNYHPKE